jgi:hypothetical protein
VSLVPVAVAPFSTRAADFALAGGTTLGGLEELKKRPPGGFEKREYALLEEGCMGRRNLGNILGGRQGEEEGALCGGSTDG